MRWLRRNGLECPKASPERDLPVAIVDDRSSFSGFVAQIFRQHAQGLDERFAVGDVEAIAIEIREHPFMRIEAVAVRKLNAGLGVAKLRTNRRRS